jgi:hypothetical protein
VVVLNPANAVYAKARDLAALRQESRREALRIELETARSLVTTSLSSAFLLTSEAEVRDAFAQVIRCCRNLSDEALQVDTPTLDSLHSPLRAHRAAVKNAEALLRTTLGVTREPDVKE